MTPIPEVLGHYAHTLGVPFWFLGSAGRYARPLREGAIYVHHFAVPTPPVLFGIWPRIPLSRLPFAFGFPLAAAAQPAFPAGSHIGRGRMLRDQEGRAVAETVHENIYLLFNLLGEEDELRCLVLRHVLDLALPPLLNELTALSPHGRDSLQASLAFLRDETADLVAHRECRRQAAARRAYLAECRNRLQDETAFLDQEMRCIEDNLEEYGRRITAETRRLSAYQQRLTGLRGIPATPQQHLKDLDHLKELPEVRDVQIRDGRITVYTVPLRAEYGNRTFHLGSFQIAISFAGEIRIHNLTDALGAYDHPHVYQGRPCLGNIREGLAKMIGEYQFVAAVYVLLDFLKTVNPKDWRIPILYWPEVRS